ncbi:hypothetical protein Tco_1057959 [Tanacetum coccineum]|uniref:Uncharacterized protein n=1 Tax=Tanacetum coccineum TaxID=301880 RepID=A0ABQ5H8S4_9ASTR
MVKHLEGGVKFLMYQRFVQVFLDKQVEGMTRHKEVYVIPSHTKKVFANMKRPGKGFSGRVTPLFPTMMVQAPEDIGEDLVAPFDSHSTPIISQSSSSKPQKKKSRRKQRKDSSPTEPVTDKAHVSTPSYDPPQSGEDIEASRPPIRSPTFNLDSSILVCPPSNDLSHSLPYTSHPPIKFVGIANVDCQIVRGVRGELLEGLQKKVLDLEKAKTAQAKEIASLKKRVKQLEKRSLGDQEDASKLGRKITDLDANAEVTLVDETQEMNDDNLMFNTDVLEEKEKEVAKKEVSTADPVTTAGEVVTTANVEATTANAPRTTIDQLTQAQTLIEIKAAKPKVVTSAATTTTTTRPKARGVVVQEPSKFKTTSSPLQASQLPHAKDKGKTIMVEPERPLKKKDQVALDEEMARNLEARMQVELIEEERLARQKEEEANIALIESWDNMQAMMEVDFELAQRLQAEEQGEITIKERSRLFIELMNRRKKHFAKLRAEEIRRKPPTKAQKRNQMSIYLKNMAGYKHKVVKDSEIRTEECSKRAGDELESDKSKKQNIDEHVEAEKDDDPEEEEMKKHMEIVQDKEEIAIDAIPLAIKPLMIVEYYIVKEGQKGFYHLMRADGSLKRYSLMIRMLQGIDREDLETLWKLVKEKHGINRPVDEYERVLLGDMKVIFEPDIKSKVWRSLQGYKVTIWKLFDSCGVHFVRFKNLHIFMLVEKRYTLTPITISNMLNKKLQAGRWNRMCYQLLKLMTKQGNGQ